MVNGHRLTKKGVNWLKRTVGKRGVSVKQARAYLKKAKTLR